MMPTQRDFAGEKGRRIGKKYPKILIYILLMLFLSGLPPIIAETPAAVNSKTKKQKRENKIEQAKKWYRKGITFFLKEEYAKASECLKKTVELNSAEIGYILLLTMAYRKDEKFDKAYKLLNEAIDKFPKKEDQKSLQIEIADVHFWRAEYLKKKYAHSNAIKHYKMAYNIDKVYRLKESALDLNNIGGVYNNIGENHKAMEYFKKSLPIWCAVGYQKGEATTLSNIGAVYSALGQKQKALEYYNKALSIRQTIDEREGEANTLNDIGAAYIALDENQKALEYFEKALSISRSVGYQFIEAVTLNNIGHIYNSLGQNQKALEYYEKALLIYRAIGDRSGEATTLNNIGLVYPYLGNLQKPIEYFERSLPIMREIGELSGEATILNNFMFFGGIFLNKIRLSIFYGKQSVNAYQELRTKKSGLEKKIQRTYLENKKYTYRFLAKNLISKGRLSEAQQVLDMLKEEEYFEFISRDRSYADVLSTQMDFTEFEKQWLEHYNAIMEKLAKVNREHHVLKFKNNRSEAEEKKLKELETRVKEEIRVYEDFMAQIKEAFDRHEKEIQSGMILPDVVAKKPVNYRRPSKNCMKRKAADMLHFTTWYIKTGFR